MRILIVKTSSYGDIIQTFFVLEYLFKKYPEAKIDWLVGERAKDLVSSHPLVKKVISFTNIFNSSFIKKLREKKYDIIFDLQGNMKSGILTFLSRGKKKVGFDIFSCAELGNIFFTNKRYKIDKKKNIRLQYLDLVKKFFKDFEENILEDRSLKISLKDKIFLDKILNQKGKKIFVSLHSKWKNKRLKDTVLEKFLEKISKKYNVFYFFTYFNEKEKKISEKFFRKFSKNSCLLDKISLAKVQYLINNVDLVISYDSCLLHFCTKTSSFSIFGPSKKDVYKPIGEHHIGVFGNCPFGKKFSKRCSSLRNCKDNKCMDFSEEKLFLTFSEHFNDYLKEKSFII